MKPAPTSWVWTAALPQPIRPNRLHLVTSAELEELRRSLLKGEVPQDFEAKLFRLAGGDLLQRSVARYCRCFIALLAAAWAGDFVGAVRSDCEQLLRVLAYVRKNDDAIPDHLREGFFDDQQEVQQAAEELAPLLKAYKAWRLRQQVPSIWQDRLGLG